VKHEAGRSDEVGEEDRVRREDAPLEAVHPNGAAYKEVPGQDVGPLLRHEVRVGHHADHGSLGPVVEGKARGLWVERSKT